MILGDANAGVPENIKKTVNNFKTQLNDVFGKIKSELSLLNEAIGHFSVSLNHDNYSGMITASAKVYSAIKILHANFNRFYDVVLKVDELNDAGLILFADDMLDTLKSHCLPQFVSTVCKLRSQLDACWLKGSRHPDDESAKLYIESFINGCQRFVKLYPEAMQIKQKFMSGSSVQPSSQLMRSDYGALCNANEFGVELDSGDEKLAGKKIYVTAQNEGLNYRILSLEGKVVSGSISATDVRNPAHLSAMTKSNQEEKLMFLSMLGDDIRAVVAKRGHAFLEPYWTLKQMSLGTIDREGVVAHLLMLRAQLPAKQQKISDKTEGVAASPSIKRQVSFSPKTPAEYKSFWQQKVMALEKKKENKKQRAVKKT